PIGERGGIGLYLFVDNSPSSFIDSYGLDLVVQGSKEFQAKTEKDLDQISKSCPEGKNAVEQLKKSANKHVIKETTGGNGNESDNRANDHNGVGTGTTTQYNSNSKTGGTDDKGSNQRPPYVGLAHELGHAIDNDTGTHPSGAPGQPREGSGSSMGLENAVRRGGNVTPRSRY